MPEHIFMATYRGSSALLRVLLLLFLRPEQAVVAAAEGGEADRVNHSQKKVKQAGQLNTHVRNVKWHYCGV